MTKRFLLSFYGILAGIAAIIYLASTNLPSSKLTVTILDVGQGDSILIRTPLNQKILIDGGPGSSILTPLSQELGFLERRIELLIITHPDADHIAGFTEIFRRYQVENVLLTGVQHSTAWYRDILTQIANQNIPTLIASSEVDFDFGSGVVLDTVWPREPLAGKAPADANAASVVSRLTFGQTAILLTGDFDEAGEGELLRTPQNLAAEVLKLGHHGAKTSSSAEFLQATNPQIALVSAGEDNQFGHPSPEIIERVKDQEILETAKMGSIRLISDGVKWRQGIGSTNY
ncbi:MAG: MBL fold metallo-hydrolase [Patescibacteria group bacterium]